MVKETTITLVSPTKGLERTMIPLEIEDPFEVEEVIEEGRSIAIYFTCVTLRNNSFEFLEKL